jgi:hypothetical protein
MADPGYWTVTLSGQGSHSRAVFSVYRKQELVIFTSSESETPVLFSPQGAVLSRQRERCCLDHSADMAPVTEVTEILQ